jgi:hypothetical protein
MKQLNLKSRNQMPKFWQLLGFAVAVGSPAISAGQVQRDTAHVVQTGALIATRAPSGSIHIDGKIDDAEWKTATWNDHFTQREPVEGVTPQARTEIAFMFDDAALYVAGRMHSAPGNPVRALVTRRDREGTSEQLVVSLDTYHDRRTAYSFGVTAAGVRMDYLHASDDQSNRDYSFDPVWEASAQRSPGGWTAEMRIPFTQLRFNKSQLLVFGVNVARLIPATSEEDYLVLVRRNETGWASHFADLTGVAAISSSRRIELLPYVASSAQLLGNPNTANPFVDKNTVETRAGVDLKVGLGPSLTLAATVNPDFGQVEADPAQVNLSAFETVFPERRPFFTEGAQLLRANQLSFFVSRRIGQGPRYSPSADYVEPVVNTTILGAAKVTGRLPSGLSVGMLGALTGPERARTFDVSENRFASAKVEPLTSFGVMRLQQEFGSNRSTAGIILTNVHRSIDGGSPLAQIFARNAITGGVEWQLRFRKGEYVAYGTLGFSHVAGDSAAMIRIQRSSAHYFGRPDETYTPLDPHAREINGSFTSLNVSKNAGRVLWTGTAYGESPGLEINDAGRIGAADDRGVNFQIRYRDTKPGKRLRYWDAGFWNFNEWNYGGVNQQHYVQLLTNQTWKNFWQTNLNLAFNPRALLDNLTRGGPLMGYRESWQVYGTLSSSSGRKTQWSLSPYYAGDEMGGWNGTMSAGLSVRPGNRIELSVSPSYGRWVDPRQYNTRLAGGTEATYGSRYVFSYVDRSELSTTLRLNYAIRPDLTLETYAQPFASTGHFYRPGELPAARSYKIREYGTDGTTLSRFGADSIVVTDGSARFRLSNNDFNVLSFRSNVVLRWEWRRGSTAYLVWQQNRGDQFTSASHVTPGSLFDAITSTGDNFAAIKVNYWIPF